MELFYTSNVSGSRAVLDSEESTHCIRVLRHREGDMISVIDGRGSLLDCRIEKCDRQETILEVTGRKENFGGHDYNLEMAVAPTKNMERYEWFMEKATEIGFDELTFLSCRFSERKVVKTERIDKILVAAMKQSHKAFKPVLNGMEDFRRFVARDFPGQKFIAHCYDESDIEGRGVGAEEKTMDGGKPFLLDVLDATQDTLVMVGPEGDFSVEEVRLALQHGFRPVSLGRSETGGSRSGNLPIAEVL